MGFGYCSVFGVRVLMQDGMLNTKKSNFDKFKYSRHLKFLYTYLNICFKSFKGKTKVEENHIWTMGKSRRGNLLKNKKPRFMPQECHAINSRKYQRERRILDSSGIVRKCSIKSVSFLFKLYWGQCSTSLYNTHRFNEQNKKNFTLAAGLGHIGIWPSIISELLLLLEATRI